MAQKIRTQDVMELFAEKLDKAIEKFDLNEKIITTMLGGLELFVYIPISYGTQAQV